MRIYVEQVVNELVHTAIDAAEPGRLLAPHITPDGRNLLLAGRPYQPSAVFLISVGKAAVAMAGTAAAQLGDYLHQGIVISKEAHNPSLPPALRYYQGTLSYYQGSHPVPDERSLQATAAVKDMLADTHQNDLVLCLISGGTSALLTDPLLPLPHWQRLNQALLACGCPINEINTVRQMFDRVKGGGLARWAAPAETVSLILSDVIGSRLEHIGSGPTVPTAKEPAVVRKILDRFNIWHWLDGDSAALVKAQLAHLEPEPPAAPDAHHLIIGDVSTATGAAAAKAAELGFETAVISNTLTGEAREIGRMAAERAKALRPNQCLIWGGESTVTLRGNGRGGRNQEIALAAAIELDGTPGGVVAAFSTDAEDGPTPVAGAWVTGETISDAAEKGLDAAEFLAANNSYTFFERLGRGHITAERGTNVNDVLIVIKGS